MEVQGRDTPESTSDEVERRDVPPLRAVVEVGQARSHGHGLAVVEEVDAGEVALVILVGFLMNIILVDDDLPGRAVELREYRVLAFTPIILTDEKQRVA
ncbi:MAG TPA: hypothetical protein VM285_12060 [Polyangia bacterium]|nr:hypothetical protein [Polyangia bacterium]